VSGKRKSLFVRQLLKQDKKINAQNFENVSILTNFSKISDKRLNNKTPLDFGL